MRPTSVPLSCHGDTQLCSFCLTSGLESPGVWVGDSLLPWGQEEAGAHSLLAPQVSLSGGLTPNDPEEVCVDVEPLLLAPGGFFGVSAATSTLAGENPTR